jgi:hypothetical protein
MFSSPHPGLFITDTEIRVAAARLYKGKLEVIAKGKKKLPEAAVEHGVVMEPKKYASVLKKVLSSLKPPSKTKAVTVCLPVDTVYTLLLRVPPLKGRKLYEHLLREMAKTIPENVDDLSYQSAILSSSKDGKEVAVSAACTDVLSGYTDICREAGFQAVSFVTVLSAASYLMHLPKETQSLLLIAPSAIALLHGGRSIDEMILPDDASKEQVDEAVTGFQAELRRTGTPASQSITLQKALPWLTKKDLDWAEVVLASIAGTQKHHLDFQNVREVATKPQSPQPLPEAQKKPGRPSSADRKRLIALCVLLVLVITGSSALVYFARFAG